MSYGPIFLDANAYSMLQPYGEPRESLRGTIWNCKLRLDLLHYKKPAVVVLISRVGTSPEAKRFLDELRADEEVGHLVYSSMDDLNEKREFFERGGDNTAYMSLVSH